MSEISGWAGASAKDRVLHALFSGRRRFQLAWFLLAILVVTSGRYPSALGLAICFCGATLRFVVLDGLASPGILADPPEDLLRAAYDAIAS